MNFDKLYIFGIGIASLTYSMCSNINCKYYKLLILIWIFQSMTYHKINNFFLQRSILDIFSPFDRRKTEICNIYKIWEGLFSHSCCKIRQRSRILRVFPPFLPPNYLPTYTAAILSRLSKTGLRNRVLAIKVYTIDLSACLIP